MNTLLRGIREILLPLLLLLASTTVTSFVRMAWAATRLPVPQQQVPITDMSKDSHYHLLLENNQLRVFALTLPPHQQSLVRHELNFLTVSLDDCDIIMWRNGESPIEHFTTPKGEIRFFLGKSSNGIRNDTRSDYRNVTIEFLDPEVSNYGYRYESGQWDYGPSALSPPVDPEAHFSHSLNLEKAVAHDVQLLPKEQQPATKRPQLLVAVTALSLSAGADTTISLNPGEVFWRDVGQPALTNPGSKPVRMAVVEFKPFH